MWCHGGANPRGIFHSTSRSKLLGWAGFNTKGVLRHSQTRASAQLNMKGTAKLMKTNGEILEVIPVGEKFTLQEIQTAVGGYIEMGPRVLAGHTLFVCDNGRNEGKCINIKATALQQLASGRPRPPIVGDAILVPDQFLEQD